MSIGAVTVRGDNRKCFKNKEKREKKSIYDTQLNTYVYTRRHQAIAYSM